MSHHDVELPFADSCRSDPGRDGVDIPDLDIRRPSSEIVVIGGLLREKAQRHVGRSHGHLRKKVGGERGNQSVVPSHYERPCKGVEVERGVGCRNVSGTPVG